MRKRIIAFYDLLLFAIICGPMIVTNVIMLFIYVTKGTREWLNANWHFVLIFAINFSIPKGGILMFRYCDIDNNSVYFHYFPFGKSWKIVLNNIDIRWNQNVLISEIEDIELVKLTKEEKQTKVHYKHWFNKYLKIDLKYGNSKYVYVGNYSNFQIKRIIKIMINK